jgi:hypothetical protein
VLEDRNDSFKAWNKGHIIYAYAQWFIQYDKPIPQGAGAITDILQEWPVSEDGTVSFSNQIGYWPFEVIGNLWDNYSLLDGYGGKRKSKRNIRRNRR